MGISFTLCIIVSGILLIVLLTYLLNERSLFYHEDPRFTVPSPDEFMDPRVAPVRINHGNSRAILCIHGYTSSPYIWEYVIERANTEKYDLYAPLLPGCGTSPEDFTHSNFSQYLAQVVALYTEIRASYDTVFVTGLSLGGTLTLRLAEYCEKHNIPKADGLCPISAPVFLSKRKHPPLFFIRYISWYTISKSPSTSIDEDHSTHTDNDSHWMGYNGTYPKQIYSIKLGLRETRKGLKAITSPILIIQDKNDKTVDYKNKHIIFEGVSSRRKEEFSTDLSDKIHTCHTLIVYDSSRDIVIDKMFTFFASIH